MRFKTYLGKSFWLLVAVLTLGLSPLLLQSQSYGNTSVLDGELTWQYSLVDSGCPYYEYTSFTFQVGSTTYDLGGASIYFLGGAHCPTNDTVAALVVPSALGYPYNCTILFQGEDQSAYSISTVGCGESLQSFAPGNLAVGSLHLSNEHPAIPYFLGSPLPDSATNGLSDSPVYFKTDNENDLYRRFRIVPMNHY